MLDVVFSFSSLSFILGMKKAIVWILYICFIYSTLGAPRGWKREEAPLVNTGDQGVFSGIHIDDRVDAVSFVQGYACLLSLAHSLL